MVVECAGDRWVMEQVGEKQDFEAHLSRLGFRHEDFALHVRRADPRRGNRTWTSHYAVRVVNAVTGKRNIYWGGPGEDWVAQFASDAANGLFGDPVTGRAKNPTSRVSAGDRIA